MRNVSYVDDLVSPVVTDTVQRVEKMQVAVRVSVHVFGLFKLELNASLGKTNATIRCAGTGAARLTKQLEALDFVAPCPLRCGGIFMLRIVPTYKHLGMITRPSLALGDELTARFGSMNQSLRPIAKKCFRNPDVATPIKFQICSGFLLSRGLFGASAWHMPTLPRKDQHPQ